MSPAETIVAGETHQLIRCLVVNKGRRPVIINGFYFLLKNREQLVLPPSKWEGYFTFPKFPITIDEAQNFEFFLLLEELRDELQEKNVKVKALCFKDTADNTYSFKIKKKYWKDLF